MNVAQDYDDEDEHLRMHPLLPPKDDEPTKLSTADTNLLNKTTNFFFLLH